MPVPTIPPLTPWPSRNDRPEVFNAKVDAFLPSLNPWALIVNAAGAAMQALSDGVTTAAGQVMQALSAVTALRNQTEAFAISAVNAPGTSATSTSTLALTTGLKPFQIQTGKALREGQTVSIAVKGDGSKRMVGPIQSYDPATGAIAVDVESVPGGAGSFSNWTIALSAPGSIPVAAVADLWAGVDNTKAVTAATIKSANEYRPRPNASALAWDVLALGYKISTVLSSGSHTEALPSGLKVGDIITAQYQQPAGGGAATVVFPANFKFGQLVGAPVLNGAANAISVMRGEVLAISPAIIIDAQFKNL